ncbi:MAG: hypothetical protein NC311_00485 [Muribaculaceae bacterium]|nr:hypothetical protein [Muribaculaceae bacterium]
MSENKYCFPVKRIGNEISPKLVILICNPGSNPEYYKRLSDYTMSLDGVYRDAGNDFSIVRQYEGWWDNILKITDTFGIPDTEILALEYYPYHTESSADIPKYDDWTQYAKDALDENIKILERCINKNVPVFGYYFGNWMRQKNSAKKLLQNYSNFYPSQNCRGQAIKLKELRTFLERLKQNGKI